MGDKLLDATQILNGLAVMISFFVGYKYALKRGEACAKIDDTPSTEGAAGGAATAIADKVRKKEKPIKLKDN